MALSEKFVGEDPGAGSFASGSGLELALYDDVVARIRADMVNEGRFDPDPVIEVTGKQGRRKTGGKWTRPDITVVACRRFQVLSGSHLEVHTYEVKTAAGFAIDALHEARAQRRRAHRSFVLVDLDAAEQADIVRGRIDEARDLGID